MTTIGNAGERECPPHPCGSNFNVTCSGLVKWLTWLAFHSEFTRAFSISLNLPAKALRDSAAD